MEFRIYSKEPPNPDHTPARTKMTVAEKRRETRAKTKSREAGEDEIIDAKDEEPVEHHNEFGMLLGHGSVMMSSLHKHERHIIK